MSRARDSIEPANIGWEQRKRRLLPYAYLSPTLVLLAALTVVPILTVFLYSLVDNVIVNPNRRNSWGWKIMKKC